MGTKNNKDFTQIKELDSYGVGYYVQWEMGSNLLLSADSTMVETHKQNFGEVQNVSWRKLGYEELILRSVFCCCWFVFFSAFLNYLREISLPQNIRFDALLTQVQKVQQILGFDIWLILLQLI